MGYGAYLLELLRPLGAYRLEEGSVNAAECAALGAALDGCAALLEEAEREMSPATAEGAGLAALERLLLRRPVADTPERRRTALAALLRIGGDSFTLSAVNAALSGCGLNALVEETGAAGAVRVRFPGVKGIPEGFDGMRPIIEDILPCHLAVEYLFWYVTWRRLEERFSLWSALDGRNATWGELEKLVE